MENASVQTSQRVKNQAIAVKYAGKVHSIVLLFELTIVHLLVILVLYSKLSKIFD